MLTQSLMLSTEEFLLEIDHLLVFATKGISEVLMLQEFGLHCSNRIIRRSNQGTASVVFFFENSYLEVVWVEDEEMAKEYAALTGVDILAHTHWQETGASPFGVGLRCQPDRVNSIPQSIDSRHQYQNTSVNFSAQNLTSLTEPICFTIPYSISLINCLDCSCEQHKQLISHPLQIKKLTNVRIAISSDRQLSNAIFLLDSNNVFSIDREACPLLDLTFDNNTQQQVLDTRPMLPIRINY